MSSSTKFCTLRLFWSPAWNQKSDICEATLSEGNCSKDLKVSRTESVSRKLITYTYCFMLFVLNRKRGEAKLCTVLAWQNICSQSDEADGIFNQVIGSFNPFCSNDEDPWASAADACASNYSISYKGPSCAHCPESCWIDAIIFHFSIIRY